MTSQRTFLALHAAHAFAALLLTGLGLPLLSNPALEELRFFELESGDVGDWGTMAILVSGGSLSTVGMRFIVLVAQLKRACDLWPLTSDSGTPVYAN